MLIMDFDFLIYLIFLCVKLIIVDVVLMMIFCMLNDFVIEVGLVGKIL